MTWIDQVLNELRSAEQTTLLDRWLHRPAADREQALAPLRGLALEPLRRAMANHQSAAHPLSAERLIPPETTDLRAPPVGASPASEAGEEALRSGQVAWLVVAGGMGTRLGWDQPKGTYPIGPVSSRSLFGLFAERLRGLHKRYGTTPQWVVQTSPSNHEATKRFFEERDYFGLDRSSVRLFPQGVLPAFTEAGEMATSPDGRPVTLPDGHGGVFEALERSGVASWLEGLGVQTLYYFQVDNPLVSLGDTRFLGLHRTSGSQMSTKVVEKCSPEERVGLVARVDGSLRVVEYSELPSDAAATRNADGSLQFAAGNTAIHALDLPFARTIAQKDPLPVHVANKPVPHLGCETPGFKFERFVFDALPRAESPLVAWIRREDEFAPVKNASGSDSPATARALLSEYARERLLTAGVELPRPPSPGEFIEVPFDSLELSDRAALAAPGAIRVGPCEQPGS